MLFSFFSLDMGYLSGVPQHCFSGKARPCGPYCGRKRNAQCFFCGLLDAAAGSGRACQGSGARSYRKKKQGGRAGARVAQTDAHERASGFLRSCACVQLLPHVSKCGRINFGRRHGTKNGQPLASVMDRQTCAVPAIHHAKTLRATETIECDSGHF